MDIIRHNDSHNVVTLYTRQRGRMAFLVPVGKSKSGRMRNSVLTLMAVVSSDVNVRAGRELYPLRQVSPVRLWHGIYSNPLKSSLMFFMAEFCRNLIRQYPADEHLWAFLLDTLERLDVIDTDRIANFHIAFLRRMLPLVGIEPSVTSWQPGDRFDMISAEMVGETFGIGAGAERRLEEKESRLVPLLLRMSYRNMHRYRFSKEQRRHVLDRVLAYYAVHLPIGELKSLAVLRDLFA